MNKVLLVVEEVFTSIPVFTRAESEHCAQEGDNITIYCTLVYSKDEPQYSKRIYLAFENGSSVPMHNQTVIHYSRSTLL